MYNTNIILYIAKKRELRETAPEVCCLTLSELSMAKKCKEKKHFSISLLSFKSILLYFSMLLISLDSYIICLFIDV